MTAGNATARVVPYELQSKASDPGASVWVSASAGSGKTKVLADRVLRLLLDGADPGKILCLTFTRAAAAEMQNRVRALLGRWAILGDDDLEDDIGALTGGTPDTERRDLARRLFAEVLDTPGGLKIQTIHAFCESLLGRFPIEAGIPPHFEVMDERTAGEALEAARDGILVVAREGGDAGNPLAQALDVVTRWVQEDEFATLMSEIANSRGRLRRLFDAHGGDLGAVRSARAALDVAADATVAALIAAACRDGAFDADGLRDAAGVLSTGKGKSDVAREAAIAAWLELEIEGRIARFDDYAAAYLKKTDGEIFDRLATRAIADSRPDCVDVLDREAARIHRIAEQRKAILTAEATEALLTLATELIDRYEAHKRQHALLDYDDLIINARALVERAAPWVLFKLDGGIDHVLIDEAQDSNADQWAVVRAIADEFFSGEGAREQVRTVFAVGDEKQSIFSFQGAAPAEFARMSEYFEGRTQEAGLRWERVPLDVSFRSASSVLRAVDAVFGSEQVRDGVSQVPIRHEAHRRGQAGRVELWPPVMPEERADAEPWAPLGDISGAGTPAHRLAHAIAGRIDRWIRDGERLDSAGRRIRAGDVLVLVRRRTDFVDDLIRQLEHRGVGVAGIDRMVLTEQLAVQDLIALGDFALMPQDDLNLAVVLKGPLFAFSEEQLFEVCHGREGPVWQALRKRASTDPACRSAVDTLGAILAGADTTPPYEFFSRILGPMKGRERILARLREEANDPIDEFLALALDYERARPASLQGFLHWLAEGKAEIARDLDQGLRDEVRIMTVHGSKGLQAPIVFLADTMQVPRPDQGLLWDDVQSAGGGLATAGRNDPGVVLWPPRSAVRERVSRRLAAAMRERQDEEYRRLLYVAMTRAEDRLYVTGYGTRQKPPDNCWYRIAHNGLEGIAEIVPFDSHGGGPRDLPEMAWTGEALVVANPQAETPDRTTATAEGGSAEEALPDWAMQPAPAEPEPPRPMAPSRPATPEPATRSPVGDDGGESFRRGLLIHRLLQTLPELPPATRDAAARRYLARPVHGLDDGTIDALVAETMAVLDHPEFAGLFGPGARTEAPVAGTIGGVVISGRIDRLLVGADTVKVLDYKTNRPPPETESGVPALYLRQMAAYRALLRKIYTDQRVECALLWTDGPILMPLSEQVLDAHAP